ncbi:NAC domain-containing protein 96-like [Mangifera indica]|uniref:NAC domain-containing protein 96-like n=1 Tax=Mangifera indica TaxID=29780 RepID=UPI001CFBE457|nr:NAC domain-containing protein 96-like [Mangifera indica]
MERVVGYRFHPTDEEIIRLLEQKRRDPDFSVHAISEANIYDYEPFQLTRLSRIPSSEKWCNFFCAPDYINVDTSRFSRATKMGYWKLTGEPRKIKTKRSNKVIGAKRILVFYERHGGSKGIKTDWVMHQYSVNNDPLYKKDFVVYCVKRKRDKKYNVLTNVKAQQKKKPHVSTRNDEPSHSIAFANGCPPELQSQIAEDTAEFQSNFAENASIEAQLTPSNCSASSPRYQVTENTLQVDPHDLAKSDMLYESNGLDHTSPSALQSHPGQGPSYSNVSSNDKDVLDSPFGSKREDNSVNPQQHIQTSYPYEDTGDSTHPHNFNLTNSVAGFGCGVSSEWDSETFIETVRVVFEYNPQPDAVSLTL